MIRACTSHAHEEYRILRDSFFPEKRTFIFSSFPRADSNRPRSLFSLLENWVRSFVFTGNNRMHQVSYIKGVRGRKSQEPQKKSYKSRGIRIRKNSPPVSGCATRIRLGQSVLGRQRKLMLMVLHSIHPTAQRISLGYRRKGSRQVREQSSYASARRR
jgi:hypothetical protein